MTKKKSDFGMDKDFLEKNKCFPLEDKIRNDKFLAQKIK